MPVTENRNPMSFFWGVPVFPTTNYSTQLQSTLSSSTSGTGELPSGVGHHPITCQGDLCFDSNGVFSCEHYSVPNDDLRTKACLIHSVALLIIEEAFKI